MISRYPAASIPYLLNLNVIMRGLENRECNPVPAILKPLPGSFPTLVHKSLIAEHTPPPSMESCNYTVVWQLIRRRQSIYNRYHRKLRGGRNGMLFVETSAKTAANCAEVFENVAKKISGFVQAPAAAATEAPPTNCATTDPQAAPPVSTLPTSASPGQGPK